MNIHGHFFMVCFGAINKPIIFALQSCGELAQLARALAWHARGHRFDSGILHKKPEFIRDFFSPPFRNFNLWLTAK